MAHNQHVIPASLWHNATVPTPDLLRHFDERAAESLNADAGGTWNPTSPIIIGGSGLQLPGSSSTNRFDGGVRTGPRAASGGAIVESTAYPSFSGGTRSRTVVVPIRDAARAGSEFLGASTVTGSVGGVDVGSVAPDGLQLTDGGSLNVPLPAHRLIDGATLTSATLYLRFNPIKAIGVGGTPYIALRRIDFNGSYPNTTDPDLFVIPTRANSTSYLVGALVLPTTPNGRQFRCLVAGTSAASQPAGFGSAAVGTTVTDGGVSWRCENGPFTAYHHFARLPLQLTPAGIFAGGLVQAVPLLTTINNVIDLANYNYAAVLGNGGYASAVFVAIALQFDGISNLRPTF